MKKDSESGIIDKIDNFARTLEKIRFAYQNLPIIGDFIAELVKIVQQHL